MTNAPIILDGVVINLNTRRLMRAANRHVPPAAESSSSRLLCAAEAGSDRITLKGRARDPAISVVGALFCDRRFGRVFTCRNGAESYYGARGFRGSLRVRDSFILLRETGYLSSRRIRGRGVRRGAGEFRKRVSRPRVGFG